VNAPAPFIPVLALAELGEGEARGCALAGGTEIVLVRKKGVVYGYHNRCPHRGTPLNWLPENFLDMDGRLIQCATHGALFRIEDGLCVHGPCAGDRLTQWSLRVEAGQILAAPGA
jgi:nitrite reductase/ring-hydroxylating ferredoxin subunit